MHIAQGSDWFWWYGEPNNSGQDFLFDYMFRERLKRVYTLLDLTPPEKLNKTIITKIELPFKLPKKAISPKMDGLYKSSSEWINAGTISMLDGPVYRENKNVDKIDFGCDKNNIYFRLYVTKGSGEISYLERINQFYIYMRNASKNNPQGHLRLICKTDNPYPILTETFEHEIALTLVKDKLYPVRLASVLHPDIWTLDNPESIKIKYNDVIDVCIPFDTIGIEKGDVVEFFMANTDSGVKNNYIPQEVLISLVRK